jgi:hypothetical protein
MIMIEKIKRNWKRILLIGAGAYVAIAIISTVVGGMLIKGRMDKMERHEDTIGKAFEERKADFRENFNKNWNAKLDNLSEGFKRTEKISDKHGLDGLKGALNTANRRLEKWVERPEESRTKLKQEIAELEHYIAAGESAYKKKWFSQRDDETLEQFERRQDEGGIDWQVEYMARCEWRMRDITDEFELDERKQNLVIENDNLSYLQEKFQNKYGEPYDGTEFQEACVVLQEQASQKTQAFLDDLAAKQAEKERKKDLLKLMIAKDRIVSEEKKSHRFDEKNPYTRMRYFHQMLGWYSEYNDLKATFEEKWGIDADGPLEKYKANWDRNSISSVDWGFLPVDYLAKEKELEALLPKLELEFDTQFLADLRERIPVEEKMLEKWKGGWRNSEEEAMKKEKATLEKLNLRPSLLALEEAVEKKWTPKTEEETLEQFERRQSEGNIQFLSALIERLEIDGSTLHFEMEKSDRNRGTTSSVKEALAQAEKEFFVAYGEVCPQANIVNVATN